MRRAPPLAGGLVPSDARRNDGRLPQQRHMRLCRPENVRSSFSHRQVVPRYLPSTNLPGQPRFHLPAARRLA
jgi:hypothetical protein